MSSVPTSPTAVPAPKPSIPINPTPAQLEQFINCDGGIDRLSRTVLDHLSTSSEARTASVLASTRRMLAQSPSNTDKSSLVSALSVVLKPIEASLQRDVLQVIPDSWNSAPEWLRRSFQDEYDKALRAYRMEQSRKAHLPVPPATPGRAINTTSATHNPIPPIPSVPSDNPARRNTPAPKTQPLAHLAPRSTSTRRHSAKMPLRSSVRDKPVVPVVSKPVSSVPSNLAHRNEKESSNSVKSQSARALSSQRTPAVEKELIGDRQIQKNQSTVRSSHPAMDQGRNVTDPSKQVADSVHTTATTASESNSKQQTSACNPLSQSSTQPLVTCTVAPNLRPDTASCLASSSVHPTPPQCRTSPHTLAASPSVRSNTPAARVDDTKHSFHPNTPLPSPAPVPRNPPCSVLPASQVKPPTVHCASGDHGSSNLSSMPTKKPTSGAKRSSRKTSPKKSLSPGPLLPGTNFFHDSSYVPQASADRARAESLAPELRIHTVTVDKMNSENTSPTSANRGPVRNLARNVEPLGAVIGHRPVLSAAHKPSDSLPGAQRDAALKKVVCPKSPSCREADVSEAHTHNEKAGILNESLAARKDPNIENKGLETANPSAIATGTNKVRRRASRFSDLESEPSANVHVKARVEGKLSPAPGKSAATLHGTKVLNKSQEGASAQLDKKKHWRSEVVNENRSSTVASRDHIGGCGESGRELVSLQSNGQALGTERYDTIETHTDVDAPDVSDKHGKSDDATNDVSAQMSNPEKSCQNAKHGAVNPFEVSGTEHDGSQVRVGPGGNNGEGRSNVSGRKSTCPEEIGEIRHSKDIGNALSGHARSTGRLFTETDETGLSPDQKMTESAVISTLAQMASVTGDDIVPGKFADRVGILSKSEQDVRTRAVEDVDAKIFTDSASHQNVSKSSKPSDGFIDTESKEKSSLVHGRKSKGQSGGSSKRTFQNTSSSKVLDDSSGMSVSSSGTFKAGSGKRQRLSPVKGYQKEADQSDGIERDTKEGPEKPLKLPARKRLADSNPLDSGEVKKRKTGAGSLEVVDRVVKNAVDVTCAEVEKQPSERLKENAGIDEIALGSNSVKEMIDKKPEDYACQQKVLIALREVMEKRHAGPFLEPVDLEGDFGVRYCSIVKQPMDLGTIEKRLVASTESKGYYRNVKHVLQDVELVWENCRKFNGMYDEVTLAANKCADDLGVLLVKLGVDMVKGSHGRRRSTLSKQSARAEVTLESNGTPKKRKRAQDDEDLKEIIATTSPCHSDNDGRLRGKEIAIFTTLKGRVKAWYRVKVDAYDSQTRSYSLTWVDEKMHTSGATFGIDMRYPVYRA